MKMIYNDKRDVYSEIKKVFSEKKFEAYSLIDEDNDKNGFYSLFNYLYLDLFKEPSLLKQYNISLNDIFQEYEIIKEKIFEEINKLLFEEDEYVIISIEKQHAKVISIIMVKIA